MVNVDLVKKNMRMPTVQHTKPTVKEEPIVPISTEKEPDSRSHIGEFPLRHLRTCYALCGILVLPCMALFPSHPYIIYCVALTAPLLFPTIVVHAIIAAVEKKYIGLVVASFAGTILLISFTEIPNTQLYQLVYCLLCIVFFFQDSQGRSRVIIGIIFLIFLALTFLFRNNDKLSSIFAIAFTILFSTAAIISSTTHGDYILRVSDRHG